MHFSVTHTLQYMYNVLLLYKQENILVDQMVCSAFSLTLVAF